MRDELTELQKQEMAGDPIFENAVINDEYVKKLKEKQSETIYVKMSNSSQIDCCSQTVAGKFKE